jgi:hypothetical protein
MAAVTNDRQYRQVLTMAMAMRQRETQDLVFNSNPVSAILREAGMFKPFTGPEIRIPLTIDKMEGQWFSGFDKLNNEPKEILNSAVFTPKNLAVGFSLSGTEMRGNEGETQVIDLYETYMDNATESMRDEWEISLHGNGTGGAGREMIGMGGALPILPTTGVYGGIDRSLHPLWQPSVFDAETDFTGIGAAGWDSTTARSIIENVTARRSKGNRYPSIWIMDLLTYQPLSASLAAIQRIQRENGGSGGSNRPTLGFQGLEIATPAGNVTAYCASGVDNVMPANTAYFIEPNSLEVRYMSDYNMVPLFPGEGAMPVNQDAYAQYLLWVGELILKNPRYSGRLIATPTTP